MIAFRLLEAAGLNHDTDVRRQGLGVSQSVDALKDGKIQAFFWSGGLPTAAILDLGHTPGITCACCPTPRTPPSCSEPTVSRCTRR